MDAKNLYSKEVLDSQGNKIGKISDMDVDMSKGVINHIILSSGLTTKYIIKLDEIMTIGDKVILKIKKDELVKK